MFDFDDIGWGDSIRDSMDKRPHPPQGGSGVPDRNNVSKINEHHTTISISTGYLPFEKSAEIIDKVLAKYDGKCDLHISAMIKPVNNADEENQTVNNTAVADMFDDYHYKGDIA